MALIYNENDDSYNRQMKQQINASAQGGPASKTFVPGIGMLGPDLGGYVKGVQAVQEYRLNERTANRADSYLGLAAEELGIKKEDLGMRKEEFGWKRNDREREEQIRSGIMSAAQDGGYEGVVDFLKGIDPERALKVHAEKLDLDTKIMKNEVLAAQAPNEINKAMVESYGILGKLGHAVLKAPEEERDAMYKQILPMVKRINPDAPDSLDNNAMGMFMLAAAQATPENQLFLGSKANLRYASQVSKASAELQSLYAEGKTAENDLQVANLESYLRQTKVKEQSSYIQMAQAEAQKNKTLQDSTESFNKTLNQASNDFNKALDSYSQVKAHMESLKKDPNNAYSQSVVQRMFIKSVNSGAMSLADEALGDTATGIPGLQKKLSSMASGYKVNLNNKELTTLSSAWETSMKGKYSRQTELEQQFSQSMSAYKNVDQSAVRKPSQQYLELVNKYGQKAQGGGQQQMDVSNLPPQIQQMANDAIQRGANPEAVKQRIQQIMQQQQQPQQGQ